jgi:hypothetical protein
MAAVIDYRDCNGPVVTLGFRSRGVENSRDFDDGQYGLGLHDWN